jgi:HD-like signal output (HDOD) protein/signal transduction histidine kinase
MRKQLNPILADMDFTRLPTPPAILIELIDTCNNTDVSFSQLAEIIQKDAGVSSKVIAAANSPSFRQWNEIRDINRLLVILGLKTVKTIAITSAVQQFFSQVAPPVDRCLDEIWYYSLGCAGIAKSLAELTAYHTPEEAYFAGLLHRLGQLALLHNYPDEYSVIFDQSLSGEKLKQAEQEKFDITSCEVASAIIDSWKIHSFISDAVLYQSEATDAVIDSSHLVKLINLAGRLIASKDKPTNEVLDKADQLFGLNQSVVENLLSQAREKLKTQAESFGICLPTQKIDDVESRAISDVVHQALGERVKGLALFGGGTDPSDCRRSIQQSLKQLQRDLGLLFGLQSNCFLLHDQEDQLLRGHSQIEQTATMLSSISVSTDSERSLASKAYFNQSIMSSFELADGDQLTVVDRQLTRAFDSEGLLYLPLSTSTERMGLIAAGLDASDWNRIAGHLNLLILFAQEAVKTIGKMRAQEASKERLLAEERDAFQLKARKVVHEANNPLGIINNYLHILSMKLGDEHPVQNELDIIKEEIERVGNIILRIRDIPAELETRSLATDLNGLIRDLHKLFQSSLFTTHEIETVLDLDDKLPPLACSRGHLKQILTNLVKNAVEAMPSGGELSIATNDKVHFNGKTFVEIVVTDNGPGIPDEIMQHIFSPVASTKDHTHAGLGLAIVKNLVDELSGSISCTSSTESGTRYQIFLPRVIPDKEQE